ncbi:MAG: DUF6456 domain-containing protein [Pseudomonadota bacterium]
MSNSHQLTLAELKRSRRLLKLILGKQVHIEQSSNEDIFLLAIVGERSVKCHRRLIADWMRCGFVRLGARGDGEEGQAITTTDTGIAYLKRSENNNYPDQHREYATQSIKVSGENQTVLRNIKESPLSSLFHRKAASKAWLEAEQFDAGERLRSDFEFSHLMPSITASWDPNANLSSKGGGRNSDDNLTDRVLGARQRLNQAIDAVGPEFSEILLDVCCFLKGMEQVERERQWPRRSAKLLLKAALSALARHYSSRETVTCRSGIQHWAAANYRPKI